MPPWLENLPWWIKLLAFLGGSLMSAFSSAFPLWLQPIGLWLGTILCLLAFLTFVLHVINHWRRNRDKPRLRMEPFHVIIIGLMIALAGVVWQIFRPAPKNEPLIVHVQTSPSSPVSTTPVQLVPNTVPSVAASESDRINRYVQLKSLIQDATGARKAAAAAVPMMKLSMNPNYSGPYGGIMPAREMWDNSLKILKKINELAYSTRSIELDALQNRDLVSIAVAGEEIVGEDPDKRIAYRTFNYFSLQVDRQAANLIDDMSRELKTIADAIKNTPSGRILDP